MRIFKVLIYILRPTLDCVCPYSTIPALPTIDPGFVSRHLISSKPAKEVNEGARNLG
jgi:hypothetical protein